jgi:hypothetical protein
MLSVAVICATGCKKQDDQNNGGNNSENGGGNGNGNGDNGGGGSSPTTPTEEGMYLGIIGFNEALYQKEISLLNSSTKPSFEDFIENLQANMGTGLYYADYTALKKLQAYEEPPMLNNVAMVTFTDGIDNVSTSNSQMDPEGYGSISAYRSALHYKIMSEQIHGKYVNAYTIGLRGNDFSDMNEFSTNLNMLASSPNNVFEVTDMTEALQRFKEIAEALYSSTTTVNLKLKVPGGYDDGQVIRFTFDNPSSGGSSSKYIEATYKRSTDARRLDDISYHGFAQGETSLLSISQTGAYYWFEFGNLTYPSANPSAHNPISQDDINRMQLWKQTNTSWQHETEFEPGSSSQVTEEKSSALIMLVLDCTTSLGSEFVSMQNAAVNFVETLVNSSGNNNGGGNNGGNSNEPEGFINGKFSVSPDQKVYFSKGNLQYQASTDKWRFAEHQYDYIGSSNSSISEYSSGWIDLFGWGTSNFAHGANCYQPWSTSQNHNDYLAYGSTNNDLFALTGLADWGMNAISNGGNETRRWRTLTKNEWTYLLQSRSTSSGLRYAKAQVAGKNGIILLPDNWSNSTYTIQNANTDNTSYDSNVISSSNWNTLQVAGAVFLPAAGSRAGTSVSGVDASGYYWSSSCYNASYAYLLGFSNSSCTPNQSDFKYYGQSVRVVCPAE